MKKYSELTKEELERWDEFYKENPDLAEKMLNEWLIEHQRKIEERIANDKSPILFNIFEECEPVPYDREVFKMNVEETFDLMGF